MVSMAGKIPFLLQKMTFRKKLFFHANRLQATFKGNA